MKTHCHTQTVGEAEVFYRVAGPKDVPVILLLHGYPTSSHMFRDLIPRLSDRFRLLEPDLPGFGLTKMLVVWGRNDPFFLPRGAEAFKRGQPDAEVSFLDAGHFALETHVEEMAEKIRDFFDRKVAATAAK
jgi:pimeloyl-ACP methyl ester carboxylesterase